MKLRRPLTLTPALIASLRRTYTLEEIGALVVFAGSWWPTGELPVTTYRAMRVLDAKRDTARRMLALLRPAFAPDSPLGFHRAAQIAKAARRAKGARAATRARLANRSGSRPDSGADGVEPTDR